MPQRNLTPQASVAAAFVAREPSPCLPVVLIPAYKPERVLSAIVAELVRSERVQAVVVVDDGSESDFVQIFSALACVPRVHLLTHIVNLGKGAALKTGLNFIRSTFRASVGAVTADADGQHTVNDILIAADVLSVHL